MGNLPFNDAIRAFHRQQLVSKNSQDLHSLVEDIYFMARESKSRSHTSAAPRPVGPVAADQADGEILALPQAWS